MITPERQRTHTVLAAVLAVVLATAYVAFAPSGMAAQVRGALGIDHDGVPGDLPGGHYALLQTQPRTHAPVGWDPCGTIHYVVNPQGAPADWERVVGDAVAALEEASGLRLSYDGTTTDRDREDRGATSRDPEPVLVEWADPDEVPALEGTVVGVARPVAVLDGVRVVYRTGSVSLDRQAFADELASWTRRRPDPRTAVVMHELGHLVGLDHVQDPGELMYPDVTGLTAYGPGDRAGLALLASLPCG